MQASVCVWCLRCVQSDRAAGSAAANRGAPSSKTAGPAESPTEQILRSHQGGRHYKSLEKEFSALHFIYKVPVHNRHHIKALHTHTKKYNEKYSGSVQFTVTAFI